MERALVRNLSDHLGNNLLHVVARYGHVSLLPWLASRLGPELESALSDENKQGLTPISLAIKVNIFKQISISFYPISLKLLECEVKMKVSNYLMEMNFYIL